VIEQCPKKAAEIRCRSAGMSSEIAPARKLHSAAAAPAARHQVSRAYSRRAAQARYLQISACLSMPSVGVGARSWQRSPTPEYAGVSAIARVQIYAIKVRIFTPAETAQR